MRRTNDHAGHPRTPATWTVLTPLAVGAVLVAAVAIACTIVVHHPSPYPIDERIMSILPHAYDNRAFHALAQLGSTPAFIVGVVAAVVIARRRDLRTVLSCAIGPVATTLIVQWVLKPAVHRHIGTGLSFPSGHVESATVVLVALILATRGRVRIGVAIVGTGLLIGVSIAVICLGWHFPTDVFAGWASGIGGVVLVDGALRAIDAWGISLRRPLLPKRRPTALIRAGEE